MNYKLLNFVKISTIFLFVQHACSASDSEARLRHDLLAYTSHLVRPAMMSEESTLVSLGLNLKTLTQLNEREHFIETLSSLRMSWHDYRLQWDPSEYGSVGQLKVRARHIWTPDIVSLTSIDENSHLNEIDAIVYHSGLVHWNPLLRLRSYCSVNLKGFPFDQQNCSIEFASLHYHGNDINITYYDTKESTLSFDGFHSNPMWQIFNYSLEITHRNYYCCNESYPVMEFNFLFRRRSPHYFQSSVIPALVLGALVPLSFLLPPGCHERLTVEMIVIVCLLFQLSKVYEVVPMAQEDMPDLAKYYIVTLLLDLLAMMGSTLVLNFYNRGPGRAPVPVVMKNIFLEGLGWAVCLSKDTHVPPNGVDGDSMPMQEQRKIAGAHSQDEHLSDQQELRAGNSSHMEKNVDEMRERVIELSTRFSKRGIHNEVWNEWQQVALAIDRLLFLFFPLAFIVSSILILT